MNKAIHDQSVKAALGQLGWSQTRLAKEIGVTPQAVTNWLKGVDFPRPDKLLKLATTLSLGFEQLVKSTAKQPIVAFRKKGNAKTTEHHLLKALAMGSMLRPLVEYLPDQSAFRTQIQLPSTDYSFLQKTATAVRAKLGIGTEAILDYHLLISEFSANCAVIIPVMWGQKQRHENALHIHLPDENVTFIYLNLDTHLEDFKFWMAHELAHIYTPQFAGSNEGEDFADAFAGALLFSKDLAQAAYAEASHAANKAGEIGVLTKYAHKHFISLYSVFREVENYAKATNLAVLRVTDRDIHAIRNSQRGSLVTEALFAPLPPEASTYISATQEAFKSPFYHALRRMLKARGTGAGYIQQVLDVSMKDAAAIFAELVH